MYRMYIQNGAIFHKIRPTRYKNQQQNIRIQHRYDNIDFAIQNIETLLVRDKRWQWTFQYCIIKYPEDKLVYVSDL